MPDFPGKRQYHPAFQERRKYLGTYKGAFKRPDLAVTTTVCFFIGLLIWLIFLYNIYTAIFGDKPQPKEPNETSRHSSKAAVDGIQATRQGLTCVSILA